MDVMIPDQHAAVTAADRRRLRQMIDSLCTSLPASGGPYGSYLRALDARLGAMQTVAEDAVDDDVVTMNSQVRVRGLDGGRVRQVLTLVYERDADPYGEKVSVMTPLGAALLGARVGEVVEWHTRRGPRRVQVEEIVFQPEAAGRFEL